MAAHLNNNTKLKDKNTDHKSFHNLNGNGGKNNSMFKGPMGRQK